MSALTNFAELLLLKWMLTTDSVTRPTAWYVATHTGDPGETGATDEVTVGLDSDYIRKTVTFNTPHGDGLTENVASVSWTVNSGSGGYTVTHISIWDAATAGNCMFKGSLEVARVLVALGVLTFNADEIIAALD